MEVCMKKSGTTEVKPFRLLEMIGLLFFWFVKDLTKVKWKQPCH